MDSKAVDTVHLFHNDAESRLKYLDDVMLSKLLPLCSGVSATWQHAADVPCQELQKLIPESNPNRDFLIAGFSFLHSQATAIKQMLTSLKLIEAKSTKSVSTPEHPVTNGVGSTPAGLQHHPNRAGGRNMFESSFALSGAQIDDNEGFKKSTRVNKPPGGETHRLW